MSRQEQMDQIVSAANFVSYSTSGEFGVVELAAWLEGIGKVPAGWNPHQFAAAVRQVMKNPQR